MTVVRQNRAAIMTLLESTNWSSDFACIHRKAFMDRTLATGIILSDLIAILLVRTPEARGGLRPLGRTLRKTDDS